jgi:hypothetical protein
MPRHRPPPREIRESSRPNVEIPAREIKPFSHDLRVASMKFDVVKQISPM